MLQKILSVNIKISTFIINRDGQNTVFCCILGMAKAVKSQLN